MIAAMFTHALDGDGCCIDCRHPFPQMAGADVIAADATADVMFLVDNDYLDLNPDAALAPCWTGGAHDAVGAS